MDRAPAASHPAHADQHPASVQFKSHLPPLWIPVGLKQCIHLMFYLRAVMKFLYQLGRCDESFMSWVPETLLEYILAQCLYLSCINTQGLDEFPSSGWNSGTPSLPHLHSSSPLEYLDPSKRTWTKVLDKAAATQEFPVFRIVSHWFGWILGHYLVLLLVVFVLYCLGAGSESSHSVFAGWPHPEEQSWGSPHYPIPLYRVKEHSSHFWGIQAMRLSP